MNTELDFLHKLENAKTEDEKTWLSTKRLIDSLPQDLQTLVYSAAIPHWFDAKILRVLNPELSRKITRLYPKLQKLPFVEPFEGRGQNIHELTRRLLLDYLWKKQRHTYRSLSQNLVDFYKDSINLAQKKTARKFKEYKNRKLTKKSIRELQQWFKKNLETAKFVSADYQIEYIYHLVIAAHQYSADIIETTGWQWHDKLNYPFVELNAFTNSIDEHINANRIKGRALGWIRLFKGLLAFYQSEYSTAKTFFFDVLNAKHSDKSLNAETLLRLGDVHMQLSELSEARACYEEALSLYRAINNSLGEAHCIHALGDLHLHLPDLTQARAYLEEALSLYRAMNEKLGEANCQRALGQVHKELSALLQARTCYEEALSIYRAIRDRLGEAQTMQLLGDLYVQLSEPSKARACYEEAVSIYRAIGDKHDVYDALRSLGSMLMQLSELSGEHTYYEEAEIVYHKAIELDPSDSAAYLDLGNLLDNLKRYDEAEAIYRKAIEVNPSEVKTHYSLGRHLADESVKNYAAAEKILLKVLELDSNHSDALYCMSCIKSLHHDSESALFYLKSAIANGFDREWTWNDPDLKWIRKDPKFTAIVGEKPVSNKTKKN